MSNILIFILGCITSYFLLYQGTTQVFDLWKVAYDIGREDARRIRESNNPNTRYVDKPPSTPSKNALLSSQSRQQAMIRDAQRQVLGESAVPKLTPSGRYTAPPVNTKGSVIFQNGVARFKHH